MTDEWHSTMSEMFGGLSPTETDDMAPIGTVRAADLGHVGAYSISGSPQTLRHSARTARAHHREALKVCAVSHGQGLIRQGDRELSFGAGQMVLYDVERPYDLRFECPWLCTVMSFPRIALDLPPSAVDAAMNRVHDARRGAGVVFENFVSNAVAQVDAVDAGSAARLGDAGISLVAAALTTRTDHPSDSEIQLRERILRYVRQNLTDPHLSVSSVAAALHMSARTIQRHFADHDYTLCGTIRRERLARVYRELEDPRRSGYTIAALAARWGFYDAPALSRAFRAEYGLTPSEVRRATLTGAAER